MYDLNNFSRRKVLATCGALVSGSVARCFTLGGSRHFGTDVIIHNGLNETVTLSVLVTETNDDVREFKQTVTLDPLERFNREGKLRVTKGTNFMVKITIDGGPSEKFHWTDITMDLAPLHVLLTRNEAGNPNVTFTLTAG